MPPEIEETEDTTTVDADDEASSDASPVDDETSSSASTAEEPVEETPEAKAEREKKEKSAARIAQAEAAEKKAAEKREAKRKQLEEQDRLDRIASREAHANDTIRRAEALIADLEQRKAAVMKGGIEGLKALGVEYKDFTLHALEETSPDAEAKRARREAQEVREELRRRDEREQQARQAAEQEAAAKRFETFVDDNAEDFPDASLLTSRVMRVLADEAAQEYIREFRTAPTFAALLPRLDKKAKEFHEEQKTKSAKLVRSDSQPSNGATSTQATIGQPANTPTNRTLTSVQAGTRAKPPRQMTEAEVDEWAAAELRAALEADRKAARSA